jgi:hypothetical protein
MNFTCTGVAVAGASLAAVSVTTTGLFAVNEIVAGDAVTPVGNPLTATAIVPLKSFTDVLLSVTCPLAPGIRDSVIGVAFSVKSAVPPVGPVGPLAAVTVKATEVFVLRVPDAPYTLIVVVPTAASAAAVRVNVLFAPIATVAVAGDTVTPDGIPLTET